MSIPDSADDVIPGSPESISDTAAELRGKAGIMRSVSDDLSRVRIEGWEGGASGAFWDSFNEQPPRWGRGELAMEEAARILDDYESAVEVARRKAADALALWDRAEQISDSYAATLADDPGGTLRQRAREDLNSALAELRKIGDECAGRLGQLSGESVHAPGWLANAEESADGSRGRHKLFSLQLDEWDRDGVWQLGGVTVTEQFDMKMMFTEGGWAIGGNDGALVNMHFTAGLFEAKNVLSLQYMNVDLVNESTMLVGHETVVEASADPNGAAVHLESFTGIQYESYTGIDLWGIEVGMYQVALAGYGGEVEYALEQNDDGGWEIMAKASAADGVGGGGGLHFAVDPQEVQHNAYSGLDTLQDWGNTAVDQAQRGIDDGIDIGQEATNQSVDDGQRALNAEVEDKQRALNDNVDGLQQHANSRVDSLQHRYVPDAELNGVVDAGQAELSERIDSVQDSLNERVNAEQAQLRESIDAEQELWNERVDSAQKLTGGTIETAQEGWNTQMDAAKDFVEDPAGTTEQAVETVRGWV